MKSESVRRHFDSIAADYDLWKSKAHYYYDAVKASVAQVVPPDSRVCEVGCGTGDVLAELKPSAGLGTDISPAMVEAAAKRHPDLRFEVRDLMASSSTERYDFVVAVDVFEHVPDPAKCFLNMARMLDEDGILVVVTANPIWAGPLHLAEKLGLKMPEGEHQWRSREDLRRAAEAAGLVERSFARSFVIPKDIPGLRQLNTVSWAESLRQRFGLIQRVVYERGIRVT